MRSTRRNHALIMIALVATALAATPVRAADDPQRIDELEKKVDELSTEIEELKRSQKAEAAEPEAAQTTDEKVDVLAREVDRLKRAVVVPEDQTLHSVYGLGAGASKVYLRDHGLSIGSYGEVYAAFEADDNDTNIADALRGVIYLGYKFDEHLVINSEFEFEHAGAEDKDENEVRLEFVTLDWLGREEVNGRAGLLLAPVGLVNELHEPIFFYGVRRPTPETRIIPSTWSDVGAGVFGTLGGTLHYRTYAMVGLDAAKYSAEGLGESNQRGSESIAEDWAGVARLDWTPRPGLELGGSVFSGAAGQGQSVGGTDLPDAWTTLYELHGVYTGHNATVRALWTQAFVSQAGDLSRALGLPTGEPVASRNDGGYVTVAYNVLPHLFPESTMTLEPFFRFEYVNTQADVPAGFTADRSMDSMITIPGIQFKPHPQVVLKLDYRREDPRQGDTTNAVEIGMGFVF